jgi:exodeoxyribonuclease VII large subunit
MTLHSRIDLSVPFAEKEAAKAKGARWDRENQTWYAPPGANLKHLRRWLPGGRLFEDSDDGALAVASETQQGVDLGELLARVKQVIDQGLPQSVWVRSEISELRAKNGHYYLTLVERTEGGDVVAQARAIIWKGRAAAIMARFAEATGAGLKTDIKVLCLAQVRFDVLYGLALIIEDVDPAFTLGDLAAKLARIREELRQAGLYDRNRSLPAPADYVRIAVISPETSAGLGDFRRETDRLQQAGLCDFRFFEATFQGSGAPPSIRLALEQVLAAHARTQFDALAIIRGGGSVTDLAWLNDLDLARIVCAAPMPVITGIGHERDSTILDEIAHRRLDTPSKVALHIISTIRDNAFAAIEALQRIRTLVRGIIIREKTLLRSHADQIQSGARALFRLARSELELFLAQAQAASRSRIKFALLALETERNRTIDHARARWESARRDVEQLAKIIVGLGPESALERGFVIARDLADRPLTSRKAALEHAAFRLQFRDGKLAVANQEFEEGNRS